MHPMIAAIFEGIVEEVIAEGRNTEICALDHADGGTQVTVCAGEARGWPKEVSMERAEIALDPERVTDIWAAIACIQKSERGGSPPGILTSMSFTAAS